MRILKQHINFKEKIFQVKMELEEHSDDVWNLYNMMNAGDYVLGTCFRKVQFRSPITGLVKTEKKRITVLLKVMKFDYDADADTLRVNGVNARVNRFMGLGQHQAMDVGGQMKITLIKKVFDSEHVRRLNQAKSDTQHGQILAMVMEEGHAQIFLVSNNNTKKKATVNMHIPKKKKAGNMAGMKSEKKNAKVKNKFFDTIEQILDQMFNPQHEKANVAMMNSVKAFVIGSPGSVKNNYFEYLKESANKKKLKYLNELVHKGILAHCTSGFEHSLKEILGDQNVQEQIQGLGCFDEAKHLDEFFETLRTNDMQACYGVKSVQFVVDNQAAEKVLISDNLFRAMNINTRREYVKLAEKAQRNGMQVIIFGSTTPSGQRLKVMTGVAAILRYPMAGLDDIEEDSDYDSEDEKIAVQRGEKEAQVEEFEDDGKAFAGTVSELDGSSNFDSEMAEKYFDDADFNDDDAGGDGEDFDECESPMVDGATYDLVDAVDEKY